MGTCWSVVEKEEAVSRCRARKMYMKQLVKARHAFATAHALYLHSLRNTASALLHFATGESPLHLLSSPTIHSTTTPPPSPPQQSGSCTWTSTALSSPLLPPPPPHPWDFWDPFGSSAAAAAAASSRAPMATSDVWETETSASAATAGAGGVEVDTPKESCCHLSVIVPRKNKGLVEVVRELDEYFLKAFEAGGKVSSLLEVFSSSSSSSLQRGEEKGRVCIHGRRGLSPMMWDLCCKVKYVGDGGKLGGGEEGECNGVSGFGGGGGLMFSSGGSHCTTLERLYAWEKKLLHEVKGAEAMKMERERKVEQLRRSGYVKAEMKKKEVEKLECRIMVAFQAIETASDEIVKLRELELRPQLHQLFKGLTGMWRGMYESHQVQSHIVHQLNSININLTPSSQPTPVMHRQAALQLELEVDQWHQSFCNLVKTQQNYVRYLTAWLRLSTFHFKTNLLNHVRGQDSPIHPLCEEWLLAIDRFPDHVASEGIRSLLTVTRVVTSHHKEELKQQKRMESAFRDLEKSVEKLGSVEDKLGPIEDDKRIERKETVLGRRAVVEMLRLRAEEEKRKHERVISVGRMMTLRNLEVGFAHVFQGLTSFSGFCTHAFELVHNKVGEVEEIEDVKTILP